MQDISAICAELLKINNVDIDRNFFAMDADSWTLVEVQTRLAERLHLPIKWRDILRCRSVSSLAYYLCSRHHKMTPTGSNICLADFAIAKLGHKKASNQPKLVIGGGFQDNYSLLHLESLLLSDSPSFSSIHRAQALTIFQKMRASHFWQPASLRYLRSRRQKI
ncbi:acyl carrier protein [Ochrobactrum sp. BTU1]|uniref:acyl carrier protein n=1 Tax=Ochrobactrum sp. BTU1 TaxID=2840456 RepID=UPI001C041378|nr:acyl carrier protein [Ochrobactrum sp. BTU1]